MTNPSHDDRRALLAALANQQTHIEDLQSKLAVQDLKITYIARMAGMTDHLAKIDAKVADINNPAQSVAEPAPGAPTETTEQARMPEAMDNPLIPGGTPNSTQHLAPDATDSPVNPGVSLQTAPLTQLVDVEQPIAGANVAVPAAQMKPEPRVVAGDPMANQEQAFPWTIANHGASSRTMACMRLARLHIEAGLTDETDDLIVAGSLEASEVPDYALAEELKTMAKMNKAASRTRPAGVVPRAAEGEEGQRNVPNLTSLARKSQVIDENDVTLFI